MLQPKKRKYIKDFRGRRKGVETRGTELAFGEFGLKSLGTAWIPSKQIEAARRTITHSLKRGGRVWIRIFPDKPVSARPAGKRMGGGKGDVDRYVAVVKPGRILFEVAGMSKDVVKRAMEKAANKLSVKSIFVSKEE